MTLVLLTIIPPFLYPPLETRKNLLIGWQLRLRHRAPEFRLE